MGIFDRRKKITSDELGTALLKSCWKQRDAFGISVGIFVDGNDTSEIDSMESMILHMWAIAHSFSDQYPSAVGAMRREYVVTLNSFPPILDENEYHDRCRSTDLDIVERFNDYEEIYPHAFAGGDVSNLSALVATNLFGSTIGMAGKEHEFAAYLRSYLHGWLTQLLTHIEKTFIVE